MIAAGLILSAAALLTTGASAPPARGQACSLEWLVEAARAGASSGSPAYRRYLREQLKEAALSLPPEALARAFQSERDPGALELLGAALATRASNAEAHGLLEPILSRAERDADPALRAAALRGLKATIPTEVLNSEGRNGFYEKLAQDPSPEVRKAVAENLVAESVETTSGRDGQTADVALRVAAGSADPQVTRELLGKVSLEKAGAQTVELLQKPLSSEDASVREAAARALGGVAAPQTARSRDTLLSSFRSDSSLEVRRAALESLARLDLSGAIPTLQSLRGRDPVLDKEIDAWVTALKPGLQEWRLVLREKQRRSR